MYQLRISSFIYLHWTDSIFSKRLIYPLFIHFQKCCYIRIYTEGKWYYVHPPCWYSNYAQVTDGDSVYKRSIREIMDSMVTAFSRALYWAYHSIRVNFFSQIIQISKFCVGATLLSAHSRLLAFFYFLFVRLSSADCMNSWVFEWSGFTPIIPHCHILLVFYLILC